MLGLTTKSVEKTKRVVELADEVAKLKIEKANLEIKIEAQKAEYERNDLEIKHMIGLEKKRGEGNKMVKQRKSKSAQAVGSTLGNFLQLRQIDFTQMANPFLLHAQGTEAVSTSASNPFAPHSFVEKESLETEKEWLRRRVKEICWELRR